MRRFFYTLAMAALSAGCGSDSDSNPTGPGPGTETPGAQFVGVYRVNTVNGNPLTTPYVVEDIGAGLTGRQYLEAGSLILEDDGTFHLLLEKAATVGDGPRIRTTLTRTGTWEYTPGQPGDMSGPVVLHMPQGDRTVDATPYTVTMQFQLDLLNGGSSLLVLLKDE